MDSYVVICRSSAVIGAVYELATRTVFSTYDAAIAYTQDILNRGPLVVAGRWNGLRFGEARGESGYWPQPAQAQSSVTVTLTTEQAGDLSEVLTFALAQLKLTQTCMPETDAALDARLVKVMQLQKQLLADFERAWNAQRLAGGAT